MWFWRIVQVLGALLVFSEYAVREYALGKDARFEAVGIGLAMMLGARGVEKLVTAWRSE